MVLQPVKLFREACEVFDCIARQIQLSQINLWRITFVLVCRCLHGFCAQSWQVFYCERNKLCWMNKIKFNNVLCINTNGVFFG